jgi:hypothetical protein
MSEQNDAQPNGGEDHDAELTYRNTRQGAIMSWGWTDGRRTITSNEDVAIRKLTEKAEERLNFTKLESGEVVARVWMTDDEQIKSIEWCNDD